MAKAALPFETALRDGWLRVEPLVAAPPPIPRLHAGEAESITLALLEAGTLLLLDEADGRAAARGRGIVLSGAVGVLIAAKKKGWLSALKPELLALRSQARFFLSPKSSASKFAQTLDAKLVHKDPESKAPGGRNKQLRLPAKANTGRTTGRRRFIAGGRTCGCRRPFILLSSEE